MPVQRPIFAGIGPEGERAGLEWSDVNLAERTVVLRTEITKTNRRQGTGIRTESGTLCSVPSLDNRDKVEDKIGYVRPEKTRRR